MYTEDGLNEDLGSSVFYHYTDSAGLIGILASESIRMTHIRYLNDEKEFTYFMEIFNREFQKSYRQLDKERVDKCTEILDVLKNVKNSTQLYIASFCEDGDQLSQWRGYANGSGYSLGFAVKDLIELMGISYDEVMKAKASTDVVAPNDNGIMLRKVIYDPEVVKEKISKLVNLLMELVCNSESSQDEETNFIFEMLSASSICKHPSFKEEKEWRLIAIEDVHEPYRVKLRSGPRGVVPYIEVPLLSMRDQFLLNKIVIGPSQHQQEQKNGIELYMRTNRKQMVNIDVSASPFRG
ncbi:DUF2971 domain-containing protein [Saccharospirillum alexandrii]|uniref:DUF2971 domain-containing protein n=1 Tax=Saccharospirillum alexandrii TaxID=2448477 RepID=UPI003735B77E